MPASLRVIGRSLVTWWDDWIPLVLVNLVWALLCLTVVLAPPATFGLYAVTHELRQGRSRGLGGLLEGTRRYFWPSWGWAVLTAAASVLLATSYVFYTQLADPLGAVLTGLTIGFGVLFAVVQFYTLPFYMEQERQSLRLALRNGLFMALAAPGYTLVVVGAAAVLVAASVLLVGPIFLGGPCLLALLGHHAVHERLVAYGKRPGEDEDPLPDPRRRP